MRAGETAVRVAENQDRFRKANERIEEAADLAGVEFELLPFICECPRPDCTAIIRLKRGEYEDVRASGVTFIVAPGHEITSVDGVETARIAHRYDRYSTMVKIARAAERSRELDPRR